MDVDYFIELNDKQATALVSAGICERARIRHLAEEWLGQANRDEDKRDNFVQQALALGVPYLQAVRFVETARTSHE